jgi:hypothetical protein
VQGLRGTIERQDFGVSRVQLSHRSKKSEQGDTGHAWLSPHFNLIGGQESAKIEGLS